MLYLITFYALFFKVREAHYLTLTAEPNLTTKEKTLWSLFLKTAYIKRTIQKCPGDVLLRRRFVTGDVSLRRRFVKETLCV
jgi:hypothetical protein